MKYIVITLFLFLLGLSNRFLLKKMARKKYKYPTMIVLWLIFNSLCFLIFFELASVPFNYDIFYYLIVMIIILINFPRKDQNKKEPSKT